MRRTLLTLAFVGLCGSAGASPDFTPPTSLSSAGIWLDRSARQAENASKWISGEEFAFCSGGSSVCCKLGNSRTTCVYDDGQCMGIGGIAVGGGTAC